MGGDSIKRSVWGRFGWRVFPGAQLLAELLKLEAVMGLPPLAPASPHTTLPVFRYPPRGAREKGGETLCFASSRWKVRRGIFASVAAREMFPPAFSK